MYRVLFSARARKQLKRLEKNVQERIVAKLERILVRPHAFVEKLVDNPAYKLRVGDYRIILDIDGRNLLILVIKLGHRRNIYT